MTLTKQKKPGQVNPSNNREPLVKPSVQQMMEKGEESQLTNQGQDQAQMKSDSFGTPAFNQPNSTVQARLKMGKPNDPHEKEADQVADKVVKNPEAKSAKPNIQRVQLSPSPEAGSDIIQRSESEDEFKVYKEHRLKMYDQQIAAIPEGTDKEKAVKKLTKEKQKFEKKATGFSGKMTKKGGWEDEGYEEKRDKKFGADYSSTIDDKKAIVKEGITATVKTVTSSITVAIAAMNLAIKTAGANGATANDLLNKATAAMEEAKVAKTIAASFTTGADEIRILGELDAIIVKYVTLIDTIRKKRDDLLADQPTFTKVITGLNAQKAALKSLKDKAIAEKSVVTLLAIQDVGLKNLKTAISASVAAANGTKPATLPINEANTKLNIEKLKTETGEKLKDQKVLDGVDKLSEADLFIRLKNAVSDYEKKYIVDQLMRRFPRLPVITLLVYNGLHDVPVDAEIALVNLQKLKGQTQIDDFKRVYEASHGISIEADLKAKLIGMNLQLALELINLKATVAQVNLIETLPSNAADYTALSIRINGALTNASVKTQTVFASLIPFNRSKSKLDKLKASYATQYAGQTLQGDIIANLIDAKQQSYAVYLLNAPAKTGRESNTVINDAGTNVDQKDVIGGKVTGKDGVDQTSGASVFNDGFSLDYTGALASDTHWLQFVARSISYWTSADALGNGTGAENFVAANIPVSSAAGNMDMTTNLANKKFITDGVSLKSPFYEGNATHKRDKKSNTMIDDPGSIQSGAENLMKVPYNALRVSSKIFFETYLVRDFMPVLQETIEIEYVFTPTSSPVAPTSFKMNSKAVSALDPALKAQLISEYSKKFSYIR
jgi:hypothetical protein